MLARFWFGFLWIFRRLNKLQAHQVGKLVKFCENISKPLTRVLIFLQIIKEKYHTSGNSYSILPKFRKPIYRQPKKAKILYILMELMQFEGKNKIKTAIFFLDSEICMSWLCQWTKMSRDKFPNHRSKISLKLWD